MTPASGRICICAVHLAKGLEFRSVAVMACEDELIPLQARIEEITDEADLEEICATERHLLYVGGYARPIRPVYDSRRADIGVPG